MADDTDYEPEDNLHEENDIDQGSDHDDADIDDADDTDGEDRDDVDSSDGSGQEQREQEVERPVSRATARVQAALRDSKAAKEYAAAVRRELEELRNSRSNNENAENERRALENMDPYERLEYRSRQDAANSKAQIDRLEFKFADSNDKTEFLSKAARTPALASVADEVETALSAMRAAGTTAPRETIATYLLGQRAIERGAASKTRATKSGAARIDRATGKPTGARSDVRREAPSGGDTAKARRARLENAII